MDYDYLIGHGVKGYSNSRVTQAKDGKVTFTHDKGTCTADLTQIEIIFITGD